MKNIYAHGIKFTRKNLADKLNAYRPGVDLCDVYGNPSDYKRNAYNDWVGIAYKMGGTRPSVQTANCHKFTLAFIGNLAGIRCFFYITADNAYYMPLEDGRPHVLMAHTEYGTSYAIAAEALDEYKGRNPYVVSIVDNETGEILWTPGD